MSEPDVKAQLPVPPRTFAILLALAEEPKHGYGLMRELQESPVEQWLLGPATLYRTLKQMQEDGLITSTEGPAEESGGPPRRYYALSGFGRRVTAAEATRMRGLVARAERLRMADR
ncbi:MAG TPA: PadR family transcriptional regulator [Gemmatimonadales bacterium]|nr:PadR family transcriptional regulator [Gemmatimonadales bacterium]